MAVQWYCRIGGEEVGPVTSEQLKSMADSAEVTPNTQLRRSDSGNWVRAEQVARLFTNSATVAKGATNTNAATKKVTASNTVSAEKAKTKQSAKQRAETKPAVKPPVVVAPLPANPRPPVVNQTSSLVTPPLMSESGEQFVQRSRLSRRGKKSSNGLAYVAVAGVIAIAVVVGLVIANNNSGPDNKKTLAEGKQTEKEKDKPVEANPPPTATQAFDQTRSFMKNGANLASRNVMVVLKESAIIPATASPHSASYLLVRLELENTHPTADLPYSSWNEADQKQQVAVFARDDKGRVVSLVPVTMTPDFSRLRTEILKPRAKQYDMLVFQMPAGEIGNVQLALSLAAFGGKGYFGLEVQGKNIRPYPTMVEFAAVLKAPPAVAARVANPPMAVPSGQPSVIEEMPGVDPVDPLATAPPMKDPAVDPAASDPAKPAAPPMKEQTIDDLKKSIGESTGDVPAAPPAKADPAQAEPPKP